MVLRRSLLAVVLAAGCGGGDAAPELLAGSPDATRALAFDARGNPVAIGGTSTFGLAFVHHQAGDRWVRAAGVAGFGARAQLLGGGALPLYALSESTLYRLDDPALYTWSTFPIPLGVTEGTAFGVDATGALYALDLSLGVGNGAVVTWTPGETRWTELAGTRPMGGVASAYVVEPSGRVTWSVPELGIVRAEAGAQATVVDCHAPAYGDCTLPITALTYDARGALTFLVCPTDGPTRVSFRLAATASEPGATEIPADDASCHGLATAADGTSLLATLDAGGETGTLSRMTATGTTWERVAPSSHALTYVLRDADTAFGFGDAQGERGIYKLAF